MDKELKKAFKKLTNVFFLLSDPNLVFGWGEGEKGIPHNEIYIGRHRAGVADYVLSPYDIEKLEYTKPGLFKAGILTIVGTDGSRNFNFPFKDKANMKYAEKFNQCLALYKQYNLGK